MTDPNNYTPPAWPPVEWTETDMELDAALEEAEEAKEANLSACVEGDYVHLSLVMHKDEVVEMLNYSARYEDHDCEEAAEYLDAFVEEIVKAWQRAAPVEGDLVGDHCDDEE